MDHQKKTHNQAIDRISSLPLHILHHILSLLPVEDIVRTGALSKAWNGIFISYPDLCFECVNFRNSSEQFVNHVETSLNKFLELNVRMRSFRVMFERPTEPITALILKWLALALEKGVEEVYIGCFICDGWLSDDDDVILMSPLKLQFCSEKYTKFNSLKKIVLHYVILDESALENLFTFCPLIEDFEIYCASGLQRLHIPKVERLRNVSIADLCHVHIDIEADSIKELTLSYSDCSSFLNNLASRFPVLESLEIIHCDCDNVVEVVSPSLKILELESVTLYERIEIDTPNLCSFRFSDFDIPVYDILKAPCQWEIKLTPRDTIETSWFVDVKNFLAKSKLVTKLDCFFFRREEPDRISFSLEDVEGTILPNSVVEKLCLTYGGDDSEESKAYVAAILSGMLWCCHPKMILVDTKTHFSSKMNFVKFLCEEFEPKDCPLLCCSSTPMKCWRHDLKEVKWHHQAANEKFCYELTWST